MVGGAVGLVLEGSGGGPERRCIRTCFEFGEELGQPGPGVRHIQGIPSGFDQMGIGEHDSLAGGGVAVLERFSQQLLGEGGEPGGGVPRECTANGSGLVAQPEELLEGGLSAGRVTEPVVHRQGLRLVAAASGPGNGVHNSVEHEGTYPPREEAGVGDSQEGAVGVPGVGEATVTDRLPQQVQIAGHVCGGHVVDDRASPLLAGPVEPPIGALEHCLLGSGHRERDGRHDRKRLLERTEAEQRGALMDTPGVEPDQVEASQHLIGVREYTRLGAVENHPHPRRTRATRVEEQRTDPAPRIGGRHPDQRQADLPATRTVMVERHPECGALQIGRHLGVAGPPPQPGHTARRLGARQRSGHTQHQRRRQQPGQPSHHPFLATAPRRRTAWNCPTGAV